MYLFELEFCPGILPRSGIAGSYGNSFFFQDLFIIYLFI